MSVKPSDNKSNYVEIDSLDKIKQSARLETISDMLISGKSKAAIVNELSDKWNASRKTINTLINEALLYLQDEVRMSKDQARDLSNIRTESIWNEATTVKQKVSVLDLFNKLNGLYVQEVKVDAGDTEFHLDIDYGQKDNELSYDEQQELDAEINN